MTSTAKAPWRGSLGELPFSLDYFEGSMYDKVRDAAEAHPDMNAFHFMGRQTSYGERVFRT